MQVAVKLGRYFPAHAIVTFRMVDALRHVEDPHHVLRWILRREKEVLAFREIWQSLRRRFDTPDALAEALGELVDRGHLRELSAERPVSGRAMRPSYAVNPRIRKERG